MFVCTLLQSSRLEAFGLGAVSLKHATVPQLLAIAWALNQWDTVVHVVRLHDNRRRCQTRPRDSAFPSAHVGVANSPTVADAGNRTTTHPPSCGKGGPSF